MHVVSLSFEPTHCTLGALTLQFQPQSLVPKSILWLRATRLATGDGDECTGLSSTMHTWYGDSSRAIPQRCAGRPVRHDVIVNLTITSCLVQQKQSSCCAQGPDGGPSGTERQQFNHFVQQQGLRLEWVGWQDPELMWSSRLSEGGLLATTGSLSAQITQSMLCVVCCVHGADTSPGGIALQQLNHIQKSLTPVLCSQKSVCSAQ
jgi:hypothetical protein